MILKLGVQHWGLKLYKVCMNGDPGLTLTYFTARSPVCLNGKNCYIVINWEILAANDQINRRF